MQIIEIHNENIAKYSEFVLSHPLGTIHQLPEWGGFQKKSGKGIYWLIALIDENGSIKASALIFRQGLPFGKCWLYCPRGPLADYGNTNHLHLLFEKISAIAREQNAIFLRFDPPFIANSKTDHTNTEKEEKMAKNWQNLLKAKHAHAHYQPEHTLMLDLSKPLDELLKEMKPKGRYNIKIAQKHNVSIRVSDNNKKDIEAFYNLFEQTTSRDRFFGHPQKYYENLLHAFPQKSEHISKKTHAKLYLAEYEGKPIAGLIATYFNDTATYYFGASGNENREVKATSLIQWQAIQDAKNAGYLWYDFFGISPENEPNHPWAGVTDFKIKFGGARIHYMPAQEIVYQPLWYFLVRTAKKLKACLKR